MTGATLTRWSLIVFAAVLSVWTSLVATVTALLVSRMLER